MIIKNHVQEDADLQLIPQEDFNIIEVTCATNFGYNRLFQIPCDALFELNGTIRMYPLLPFKSSLQEDSTIFDLNIDCLRIVFMNCPLRDQIAIAKVCRHFYETIREIWCGKARRFIYNQYKMEFEQNLSGENIREIFAIVGSAVQTLRYNTIFFFTMIQRYLSDFSGNMVSLARNFVNTNLCRNLMYMENIQVFEVEGKFITDFTIRELARYCKQLRVFRLLDTDVRCLKGQYFPQFLHLEELYIRECKSFLSRSLKKTCMVSNIKCLDIVDCPNLQNGKYVEELCKLAPNLETLNLTAQANTSMISNILKLSKLKELSFYWVAKRMNDFELLLVDQLAATRADSLSGLKFEIDRISIENQSMQTYQNADIYAVMRETTTLSGKDWCLNDVFENLTKSFEIFTSLNQITFEYCRPFSYEHLINLSKACLSLRSIRLVGCSSKTDSDALNKFKIAQSSIRPSQHGCELCFEKLVTADQVTQIKQRIGPVRSEFHLTPTLRSIKCFFK